MPPSSPIGHSDIGGTGLEHHPAITASRGGDGGGGQRSNSTGGGDTDRFSSRGGDTSSTGQGGVFLLRVDLEGEVRSCCAGRVGEWRIYTWVEGLLQGLLCVLRLWSVLFGVKSTNTQIRDQTRPTVLQVVCVETFHTLFCGRDESDQDRSKSTPEGRLARTGAGATAAIPGRNSTTTTTNNNNNNNNGGTDAHFVPRPSSYVPDWAAFGSREKEEGNSDSSNKNGELTTKNDGSLSEVRRWLPLTSENKICLFASMFILPDVCVCVFFSITIDGASRLTNQNSSFVADKDRIRTPQGVRDGDSLEGQRL